MISINLNDEYVHFGGVVPLNTTGAVLAVQDAESMSTYLVSFSITKTRTILY